MRAINAPGGARRATPLVAAALALVLATGTASALQPAAPDAAPPAASAPATPEPPRTPPAVDPGLERELDRLRETARAPRPTRDSARASWLLGLAALHGIGGPIQPAEALAWFERAQSQGEPLAAAGLAWCAIEGCGEPADPRAARRWIEALRPHDAGRALYLQWLLQSRLAPITATGNGPAPGQAPIAGPRAPAPLPDRPLLESAARAGSAHAALELALHDTASGRRPVALERFRALADRLPAAAANVELLSGREPAPSRGDPSPGGGTFEQAQRTHRGEGRPANFTDAIRLYRLAQQQGSEPAGRMLALIFSRPAPDGNVDIVWMQQLTQVDVTRDVPAPDPSGSRGVLRREPTALTDLLPRPWERRGIR